jgi:precorrin-8X/cobalt-precorrin-8 methylmutase
MDYLRDPDAIYARSFELIRSETDLSSLRQDAWPIAIRMIHACGMPDIAADIVMSADFSSAAKQAFQANAPILVDAEMVRHGIIDKTHPVECFLNDPRAREAGLAQGTTRSAAAVGLWRDELARSIVVIGNAPTALFALLEMIDAGASKPAAIIAMPVGFVGAAESKQALIDDPRGVPFITLRGRRGGSAIACAAINAVAQGA